MPIVSNLVYELGASHLQSALNQEVKSSLAIHRFINEGYSCLIEPFCRQLTYVLACECAWFNQYQVRHRRAIVPAVKDLNEFTAQAIFPVETEDGFNISHIVLSSWCIPVALGLANRLSASLRQPYALYGKEYIRQLNDQWDITHNPLGCIVYDVTGTNIFDETKQIAFDTVFLVYYHEHVHIWGGHFQYQCENDRERRAMESDADYWAGYRFCKDLTVRNRLFGAVRELTAVDVVRRLCRASYIAMLAGLATNRKTSRYHSPAVRLRLFLQGGLLLLQDRPPYLSRVIANRIMSETIDEISVSISGTQLATLLENFPSLVEEQKTLNVETWPLMRHLRLNYFDRNRWLLPTADSPEARLQHLGIGVIELTYELRRDLARRVYAFDAGAAAVSSAFEP